FLAVSAAMIPTVNLRRLDILSMLQNFGTNDIIYDIPDAQVLVDEMQRKEILEKHAKRHRKWYDEKRNYWYTYLPTKRQIKARTEEALDEKIVSYYRSLEQEEKKVTFDDFYWDWRKKQDNLVESPNTPVRYNTDHKRYYEDYDEGAKFAKQPIANITLTDVSVFVTNTIKDLGLCKKSAKTLLNDLKRVFEHALRRGDIDRNPAETYEPKEFYQHCKLSKRSKKDQVLSDEQLALLLNQLHEDHVKHPDYIPSYAVELGYLTGMRAGELSSLRWEDVSESAIHINTSEKYNRDAKVYEIKETKNGKPRDFPVTQEIRDLLTKVRKVEMKYGYASEWVFSNATGRVHGSVISSCIKNKCKQIDIPYFGVHALRKTVNSKMRHDGVSAKVAASLLGHSAQVNDRYYTYDVSTADEKLEIMEKVNQNMCKVAAK
ncbi:MAG: tyrosine-type recombinase/integrase, partial [Lachnospiraceae bacterium]|nr:tyrosine-type recombinase/integrase [Lachnospiraceae bacterium]